MRTLLRKGIASMTMIGLLGVTLAMASSPVQSQSPGKIIGVGFEDRNGNGKRDAGEPTLKVARVKVTDGGGFWVCRPVFGDKPYTVGVPAGTYFVMPVAGPAEYATVPVIKVQVKSDQTTVVDLPFGNNPLAAADQCSAYAPKRTARVPMGVVETATGAGYVTLVNAIHAADLFDTLSGPGPFTVFAPSDLAFAKFTEEELQSILSDKALLTSVLTNHVVQGVLTANDVVNLDAVTTLSGKSLPVRVDAESSDVFVGDARITATDITAANGVVHLIDTVLVP
jgi:uncharacterized surface protein with fasciclin (FAS1) repeats